jgi:hypothetical protein
MSDGVGCGYATWFADNNELKDYKAILLPTAVSLTESLNKPEDGLH